MLTVFSFYGQFLLSQDKPRHQNHQMQQACLSHESVYSFGTVEIYLLDVAFIFLGFEYILSIMVNGITQRTLTCCIPSKMA